jgi:hypothetical protein
MFETIIQQELNWEGGVVFIPLAFGLAVGLGYHFGCPTQKRNVIVSKLFPSNYGIFACR